jgi:murein DD-endopeptidase MepM/ murein hydrolase activator NlpD
VFLDPAGALERVELKTAAGRGPGSMFVASRDGAGIKGEEQPIEVTTRRSLVTGDVHSTLYESMLATGEGTELIRRFTEVFGWEIDFYREVREGDRFRALVEKRYVDDRFIGYGRLLAAEYRAHDGAHRAFHFEDERTAGYFNDSGESMQKSFLKSPVEVTRITSHFGMRFHPVHKRHRKHNGVDYGAPQGTPIWTVADGVVTARSYASGIGNHVKVRHANGYETVYGHMSRFADITVGSKVRQRQVIGYCGSTGVSTGPHVHYGMLKKGTYINPLTQKFPRGNAVPEASRAAFAEQLRSLTSELDAVEIALAAERLAGQG